MTIVDGTLGLGGHALAILEKLGPHGKLIGFDRDPRALAEAKKDLERFGDHVMIVNDNFTNIAKQLERLKEGPVQGILLDLGVSSMQLDSPERGFSFRQEGPLDMRMDPKDPLTAEEIVNAYSKEALITILSELGEERFAKRIAGRILEARSQRKIRTTSELENIIFHAVPRSYRHGRIHPATRSFQSLRLAVNKELEALREFLSGALDVLAPQGRVVIISFHSLEDRLVKNAFKEFQMKKMGSVLTKKPITPSPEEVGDNHRSRSAKLRAFQKG